MRPLVSAVGFEAGARTCVLAHRGWLARVSGTSAGGLRKGPLEFLTERWLGSKASILRGLAEDI